MGRHPKILGSEANRVAEASVFAVRIQADLFSRWFCCTFVGV